ncbi:MAG: beta-ketoacyl-ACP reductase [bacterium]|nr:MAG: beta-ketoacyl-ACP reductase [bacterium]
MNLSGKSAIVTGSGSGIGASIALTLSNLGADIIIIDKKQKEAERISEKIKALGRKCLVFIADISDFDEAERIVNATVEKFGKIDILINNAGINLDGVIWKMTEKQWDTVINVNLKGYFNYIRAVSPLFREQKSGKIVNISSINGMRGKFGQANYSAAKAGIIGLTKTVAKELGKYGINVNCVAPGLIETGMMKNADTSVREAAMKDIVLGCIGQPEDIANTVAFLCSDLSKHITGEIIKVDGGQYI